MGHQHPIVLQERLSLPVLACGESSTQLLLCSLKAADMERMERPPLTLMLCLDTSGSMMGRPLELVCESIEMLLSKLDVRDHLGMVIFNNRARLISPLRQINEEARAFYKGVLRGIQALGSTNMAAGLRLALEHLTREYTGSLSHLILFSDGQPNRGEMFPVELSAIIERAGEHFSLSCLGFSAKHDEYLLQQLARTGRGGYAYIESPETIPHAFAKELGGLLSIVGTQVQLLLRPMSGCSILGMRNPLQLKYTGQGLKIELPDMMAGSQFHLFLDIQIEVADAWGPQPLLEMELRYQFPGSFPQQISTTQQIHYVAAQEGSSQMDPVVATHLLLHEVSQAWEHAHELANAAKFPEAISLLQQQKERLRSAPGFREKKGSIRNWYEQIVDEIAVLSAYPKGERYQHVRKAVLSEMADPSGLLRRSGTSIAALNTTQRQLLGELMLKAVGMPHAYLRVVSVPSDSDIPVGQTFPLLGEASIGRMGQIQLDHPSVGKQHVRLIATPQGYIAIDLLSINPPAINGETMLRPTRMSDDDVLKVGEFELSFHMGVAPNLQLPPSS